MTEWHVYCKSCEDMSEVPDESIQLILTSPTQLPLISPEQGHPVIPFLEDAYRECFRVLSKTGVFVFNVGHPDTDSSTMKALHPAMSQLEIQEFRTMYPYHLAWVMCELGFVLISDSLSYRDEGSQVRVDPAEHAVTFNNIHEHYFIYAKAGGNPKWLPAREGPEQKVRSNLFSFHAQNGVRAEMFDEYIIRRFLTCYTEPNDWVLDIFAGSGVFGFLAFLTGRNVILYERDVEQADKLTAAFQELEKK